MSRLGAPDVAGRWGALLDTARRAVDTGATPACQLAVAAHGELEVFETLGAATARTRFPVYSATKPIVACAIWQLIDDGVLDVSRPVADYVPELASVGTEPMTVEQLMLHTAGIPTAPMAPEEGADSEARRARFTTWRAEWEPGSRFVYHAGSAHWVLVDILERLGGGKDFRDQIEQRVCAPLGLPRVLGIAPDEQWDIAEPQPVGAHRLDDVTLCMSSPSGRAAGVPGGGAIMTAADLALFYQGLLHDPARLWSPGTLADGTGRIRCTLPDPLFDAPVNRSLGLVIAGDDGLHTLRYACFGAGCSPAAFGHAGAHAQVGWADPTTGVSFSYFHNAVDDMLVEGARAVHLSSLVAELAADAVAR